MNTMITQPYAAFVGIDWADTKHDVCIQSANSSRREFAVIPHKVEEIDEWARSLYRRFSGPIAIALELSKGPIVYALQKYDYFVIFPINPSTLAKYREAFQPSRAKDDPTDAELALDLILRHPERFEPLHPQSVDPKRRAIVELLVQQPHRASDLADATGVTRSCMSKHLRILLNAGIARDERPAHDARSRVFHLQPDAMNDIRRWLEQLQQQWDAQLQSFKEHVERQAEQSDSKDTK